MKSAVRPDHSSRCPLHCRVYAVGTAALNSLIVSRTAETGSHDDLGAVEGGIKLFELLNEVIIHLKFMFFPHLQRNSVGLKWDVICTESEY